MALNQKLIKTYITGLPLSSSISSAFYLSGSNTGVGTSSSIINSTTTLLSVSSLLYTVPSGRIAKVIMTGGAYLSADMYMSLIVAGPSGVSALGSVSGATAFPGATPLYGPGTWTGTSIIGGMQGAAKLTIGNIDMSASSSIPVTVTIPTFNASAAVSATQAAQCAFGHAKMTFSHGLLNNSNFQGALNVGLGHSFQSAVLSQASAGSFSGFGPATSNMNSILTLWSSGGPNIANTSVVFGATGNSAWLQSATYVSSLSDSAFLGFYLSSGDTIAFNYALSATISGTLTGGLSTSSGYQNYPIKYLYSSGSASSYSAYIYYYNYDSNGGPYNSTSYAASSSSWAAISSSVGAASSVASLFSFRQSVGLLYTLTASGGSGSANPLLLSGPGYQLLVIEEATA